MMLCSQTIKQLDSLGLQSLKERALFYHILKLFAIQHFSKVVFRESFVKPA